MRESSLSNPGRFGSNQESTLSDRSSMEETRQSVTRRIQISRQQLLDAIQPLPLTAVAGVAVEGSWSSLDLVAHIESWEHLCLEPLGAMSEGRPFEAQVIPDHDAWNNAQASAWRELPFATIIDRAQATRHQMMALLEALPDSCWTQRITLPWGEHATLVQMVSGLAWHEEEHTKSIGQLHRSGLWYHR